MRLRNYWRHDRVVTGRVNGVRHCLVALLVQNGEGQQETVTFEVDTGFSGELLLPSRIVQMLGLKQQDSVGMRMADGSLVNVPVYAASLDWHGTSRPVNVLASGKQPLLGTSLLNGSRLTVDYVVGGPVTIEPLP